MFDTSEYWETEEWLSWAIDLDVASDAFDACVKLRNFLPTPK